MVAVKICCIQSLEEAGLAIRAGAGALGLVGPMPSGPGVLEDSAAAAIVRAIPAGVKTFLLSSETEPDALLAHVRRVRPTTLQIVDRPDPGAYAFLRRSMPELELVQVVHVRSDDSVREAAEVSRQVDALLLDSGNPDQPVKVLGGTGQTHDWSLSRKIVESVDVPVWLAGGLRAENVREALRAVRPFGLDVCSGVRRAGLLHSERLHDFLSRAHEPLAG